MRDGLRIIVVADDITGAAEMAGMAHSRGLRVQLVCGGHVCDVAAADVLVIATDTRSMTADGAVAETRRVASSLSELIAQSSSVLIFKKTDSALRGHVVAELKTLMDAIGCHSAVFMPANPSKGRVIKEGVYYIKEVSGERSEARLVPLDETAFRYDPEFPARTSSLKERFPDADRNGIIMPDVERASDIRNIVARYSDGHTLFAGAADLFQELMQKEERQTPCQLVDELQPRACKFSSALGTENGHSEDTLGLLALCGSTQSRPQALGIAESPMPLAVYDGGDDLRPWLADAKAKYGAAGALALTIPYRHRTGRPAAVHLRQMMAQMTRQLVTAALADTTAAPLRHLIIEGGATAWATLQTLGWLCFDVMGQLAPGVVQMRATNGTIVTLKPGSYPWPGTTKTENNELKQNIRQP